MRPIQQDELLVFDVFREREFFCRRSQLPPKETKTQVRTPIAEGVMQPTQHHDTRKPEVTEGLEAEKVLPLAQTRASGNWCT